MNNMIKDINDNLKTIVDNLRINKEDSISVLDNIQNQMDKKVEEAKKYKIQVDTSKDIIKKLEDENKELEVSLSELNDKYGKMNLVSIIEAGNKEIKSKINDNLISINKEKEHIADLTNKARTIKDLLIDLKKDKTAKEKKLESLKVIYDYYYEKVNDICNYAKEHSTDLNNYKDNYFNNESIYDEKNKDNNSDIENTMVFDEIASIDNNKNFKDEMTFISDQINDSIDDDSFDKESYDKIINDSLLSKSNDGEISNESTQVFNTIFNENSGDLNSEKKDESNDFDFNQFNSLDNNGAENGSIGESNDTLENNIEEDNTGVDFNINSENNVNDYEFINTNIFDNNINETDTSEGIDEDLIDSENEERLNKINDLFSSIDNVDDSKKEANNETVTNIENKIDDAYMDVFGKDINEENINDKSSTLTDIFGNPISNDEVSNEYKNNKALEELFKENNIDYNRFRVDEKNYLNQIYVANKFSEIINVLKNNNINLDNIYKAFNIFGEITPEELDNLIKKLINCGQSAEAIGIVLEKLPKVKKYNLDSAIMNYGEYVKDVDITELIIKAKELFDGGNN